MLLQFGAKNFFSFSEGFDLSYKLDGNTPKDVPNMHKTSFVVGIKGGNGSGKTNIIKALALYKELVYFGADNKNEYELPLETFFDNKKASEFYFDFMIDGVEYSHEFLIKNNSIIFEQINRTKIRKTTLITRKGNKIDFAVNALSEIEKIKLKPNASLVSLLKTHKFKNEMTDLKKLLSKSALILTNATTGDFVELELHRDTISEDYFKDENKKNFALKALQSADSGISDIEVLQTKNEKGEDIYFPVFKRFNRGQEKTTLFYQESSGNQKIYKIAHLYNFILNTGGLLALDEFDIHLHSMLLPSIVELFENKETNPHGAQFLFTAHNTEIIDKLGKYRTVLVNREDNESYCYRLDEIPGTLIRNDRPISPLYSANKIGGTPNL
jgi:AAA15 family ATPase/GTPase